MKTTEIAKRTIISFITIVFSVLSHAQEGRVWARIKDDKNLPISTNGEFYSTNPAFNQLINRLNIYSVKKALPASKSTSLQNVYEISCRCNEVELYTSLINQVNVVSDVEYAPNYETLDMPNDYYATFTGDYALDLINAQAAWNITHGDSNFIIAISDENFYPAHEELVGKITYYDSTNTLNRTHGTAVAILAAGNTNNEIGKSSIGYDSKLALYRMNYNDMLVASYAGAKVINLSWTSGCSFNQYAQDAINEAYNNGSFLIAAAGNGTTCGGADNLVYPAAFENVFSVTSVGPTNNHERTIGNPETTHQHNNTVDLSAPGYDVAISASTDWYLFGSGTSYAAPQVSGTVALMLAVNPCLTQANIEYILKSSSAKIDSINPLYAGKIGAGRLDAAAAVEMAKHWNTISVDAIVNSSCEINGGKIQLSASGIAPFEAIWDNGLSGLTIDSLTGGLYHVRVTDSKGCFAEAAIAVDTVIPIVLSAEISNVSCLGLNDGMIDLTITQGNAQSIVWNYNNSTIEDISNLPAGNYSVIVIDSNNCRTFGTYVINEPEKLSATIVTQQYDNTANLDLIITGGTPSYDIVWNNSVTTEDQENVEAGFYQANITDANGCTTYANVFVEVNAFIDTTNQGDGDQNGTANIAETEEISFELFPNPTIDIANVKWNGNYSEIIILNTQGQIVMNENIQHKNTFRIDNIQTGTYFVKLVHENNNTVIQRLIIQ